MTSFGLFWTAGWIIGFKIFSWCSK